MPFEGPLDYAVPEGMELAPGDFVKVELGARVVTGVVWGAGEGAVDTAKLKPVALKLDVPPMRDEMRAFPHPRSQEAIVASAARWGSTAGCEQAEAFELLRSVR